MLRLDRRGAFRSTGDDLILALADIGGVDLFTAKFGVDALVQSGRVTLAVDL